MKLVRGFAAAAVVALAAAAPAAASSINVDVWNLTHTSSAPGGGITIRQGNANPSTVIGPYQFAQRDVGPGGTPVNPAGTPPSLDLHCYTGDFSLFQGTAGFTYAELNSADEINSHSLLGQDGNTNGTLTSNLTAFGIYSRMVLALHMIEGLPAVADLLADFRLQLSPLGSLTDLALRQLVQAYIWELGADARGQGQSFEVTNVPGDGTPAPDNLTPQNYAAYRTNLNSFLAANEGDFDIEVQLYEAVTRTGTTLPDGKSFKDIGTDEYYQLSNGSQYLVRGSVFDRADVVPEPASLALIGLGVGSLLLRRRRRA